MGQYLYSNENQKKKHIRAFERIEANRRQFSTQVTNFNRKLKKKNEKTENSTSCKCLSFGLVMITYFELWCDFNWETFDF